MATTMKRCKVCGCEYEYCRTAKRVAGVFRWQDVACSPEHGSIYLAKIRVSRGENTTPEISASQLIYMDDADLNEEDDIFNEDFEDDDSKEIEIEKY